MKISNDQVSAVEQQQRAERGSQGETQGGVAFGELLAREMDEGSVSALGVGGPRPLGVNPLLMAQVPAVEKPQAEQKVMESLDSLLNDWEEYAGQLESQGESMDLKDAYKRLSRIGGEIERLKAENPDMGQKNPGLKSIVDELEVLSVTETFKFNRGDYV